MPRQQGRPPQASPIDSVTGPPTLHPLPPAKPTLAHCQRCPHIAHIYQEEIA